MDSKFRPFRVLFFVIGCIALLVFTYLLVFRIDFGGSTNVRVRFEGMGTIQSGSPVRQSGVKVGSVSQVSLAPEDHRKVDVELSLYSSLVVRSEDRISIVTGGLLGDQYIDIAAGRPDAPPVLPGQVIQGQPGLDLKLLVDGGSSLIRELGTTSRILADFVSSHAQNLDRIVADTERGVKAAADAAEKANRILDKAESVDTILADAQRGIHAAADTAERANRILAKVEQTWDPASKDFQATLLTLKETSQSLKTMVDGLGSPGAVVGLLSSPATAKSTQETLENLQSISRSLKNITSTMETALK